MTRHITPPQHIARLQDRVRERDREYFERHPSETEYLRPHVPGEAWPFEAPEATHVLVTQIVPGFRAERPLMKVRRRARA